MTFAHGRLEQPLDLSLFLRDSLLVSREAEPKIHVDSCSNLARNVRPGDAFFAVEPKISTEKLRAEVELAIQNGCKVVIADRPLENLSVPLMIVKNPAEAYGHCVHELWGNPGESLRIIGVTGTYGKTSTSYLIAGMLAESGEPVGLIGTLGIYDGEKMLPSSKTTPAPEEIAYSLMRMLANGCTHVVLEISSEAIERFHLAGLKLDALCLSNIRRNHLDRHETLESYRRTKLAAFRYLKEDGLAICNADDRITSAILPLIEHSVLTVGIRNSCEISGMLVERNIGEQTYLIYAGTEAAPIQTKMIGEEHAYNSLTTAALGLGLGIDLRTTIRGIERVEAVPGRMERIDCGQPFGVFVDCAPTPEALSGSLRTLRKVTEGRLFCVLGMETQENDPSENELAEERKQLVQVLQNLSDYTVLTADELQSPKGKLAAEGVQDLLESIPGNKIRVIETRPEAISWTLSHAEPEDAVLIVGRGCSDFQRFFETEEQNLCDRAFTKQWLYENQPCLHGTLGPFF